MYWLQFVKILVLPRCKILCLNMLVRHHSVSCSAYLEIHIKNEDFHIFSDNLFHVKSWPLSVFLKAEIDGLYLACFWRMLLQHLRKHLICFRKPVLKSHDSADCLAWFVHQVHSASMLYKGRQKTKLSTEATIYKRVF